MPTADIIGWSRSFGLCRRSPANNDLGIIETAHEDLPRNCTFAAAAPVGVGLGCRAAATRLWSGEDPALPPCWVSPPEKTSYASETVVGDTCFKDQGD
jgi:hypothetical protein